MSKRITDLIDAAPLDGSEFLEIDQAATSRKITINDLLPVQLQGDKAIDLNGHRLEFSDHNGNLYQFWSDIGNEHFDIVASNDGGINQTRLIGYASVNDGFTLYLSSKTAQIEVNGDENAIEYTANAHTFNGKIITPSLAALDFADDAAAASGGIPVGSLYHTSGTLKIRLV